MTRAIILALLLSACAPINPGTYLGVAYVLQAAKREPCPYPKVSVNNVCMEKR